MACKEVQEWQRRTVAAATCIAGSLLPARTTMVGLSHGGIYKLLPILTWTEERRKPQEECKKAISVLCESALRLALDIRRTRAVYGIMIPKELGLVDKEHGSIVQGISLGPRLTKEPTRIVFVLSGALIRRSAIPHGPERDREVLEKAQVVGELPARQEGTAGG